MRKRLNNKKGVAIIIVSVLAVMMIPLTIVMINLTTSQKKQSMHLDSILKLEQISLSGLNSGYSRLKDSNFRPSFEKYHDISVNSSNPSEKYDLSIKKTGGGFFNQDIYMMISKSENKDVNGKTQSSIIVTDAEQFQQESSENSAFVMTHDYWTTSDHHDIDTYDDFNALRNKRGYDQLRSLEVKKFEMEESSSNFENSIIKLKDNLPPEIQKCWREVSSTMKIDKINGTNIINQSNNNNPPIINTEPPSTDTQNGNQQMLDPAIPEEIPMGLTDEEIMQMNRH